MPKHERPPGFMFYPADWLADDSVALMSLEAVGAHIHLLAHAWGSKLGPAVLPADDAALSRLSRAGERWEAIRLEVLRAWRVDESAGTLTQPRLAATRVAQIRRHKRAQEGGRATQKILRDRRLTSTPSANEELGGTSQAGTLSFSFTSSDSKNHTPTPEAAARRATRREWEQAFTLFWQEWPRKVAREAALRAWMKLCPSSLPECQPLFDWIDAGRAHHQQQEWSKCDPQYIPHLATWLNDGRFRDVERPRPAEGA